TLFPYTTLFRSGRANTPLPCRPEASGTLDCCRITAHPETILAPGTSPVSCGGPEVLGFCGLWEVDYLRNLWPTIGRSQLLAGHEGDKTGLIARSPSLIARSAQSA